MVQLTSPLLKYIPEWYHLKRSGGLFFKRQAVLYLTRFNKNISWSQRRNAVNRFEYALKGEMFFASRNAEHRRDINRSRIAAACDEHGFKYHHLISTLPKLNINLNLFSLSRLAIYEPETFKSLVDIAREATNTPLDPANFNPHTIDSKEDMATEFVPIDSKTSQ